MRHIPFIVFLHQKQYIFIHDTILEAIKVGNTQIEVMNLRKKLNELGALDPETDQSGIEAEFGVSTIVVTCCEIVAINLCAFTLIILLYYQLAETRRLGTS